MGRQRTCCLWLSCQGEMSIACWPDPALMEEESRKSWWENWALDQVITLIKNVQGSNQQERPMGKQKDCTERKWITRTQAKKTLHSLPRLEEAQRIASVNMGAGEQCSHGGHPRSVAFDSAKERVSQLQQRGCAHPASPLRIPSGPRGLDTAIAMRVSVLPQISNAGASPEGPTDGPRGCVSPPVQMTSKELF